MSRDGQVREARCDHIATLGRVHRSRSPLDDTIDLPVRLVEPGVVRLEVALACALACGATMVEAASFANRAAGIVVGKVGTATAGADELLASFVADERG